MVQLSGKGRQAGNAVVSISERVSWTTAAVTRHITDGDK